MRTRLMFLGSALGGAIFAAALLASPKSAAAAETNMTAMTPSTPWQANGVSEVVKMFKGGISSEVIVNYINNSPLSFYMSADNIIAMQQQGVPEPIVQAMIKRNGELGRNAPAQVAAAPGGVTVPAQAPAPQYYSYSYSGDPSFDSALAARQANSYNNYVFAPPAYAYAAPAYNYYDPYYPWGWDSYYPGVVVGGGFGFGHGFGFDRGFHGGIGHGGFGGGFHGGGGGFHGGGGGFHGGGGGGAGHGGGHR